MLHDENQAFLSILNMIFNLEHSCIFCTWHPQNFSIFVVIRGVPKISKLNLSSQSPYKFRPQYVC